MHSDQLRRSGRFKAYLGSQVQHEVVLTSINELALHLIHRPEPDKVCAAVRNSDRRLLMQNQVFRAVNFANHIWSQGC